MSEHGPGRWRAPLMTGALVLVAAIAVWFMWFHYVHQLWTRMPGCARR